MSEGPDSSDLYRVWMEQWRRFFAAQPAAGPAAAWTSIFDRFFTAQSTVQELVDASVRAWSDLLPRVQAGQDWSEAATEYSRRVRDQFFAPLRPPPAAEDPDQLWRRYLDDLRRLGAPLADALEQIPGAFREAALGADSPFARLSELVWQTVEAAAAPAMRAPRVGPGRETAEKVKAAFDAWVELGRAQAEYQTVLADTWAQAFERYLQALAARAGRGDAPSGQRDLVTLFLETAEAVFTETFLTDEYVRAQGQAGNAAMRYLVCERELVDAAFKVGHFPTRTEVDEAHRQIHELRSEVRALRDELRKLRAGEDVHAASSGAEGL